MSQEPRQDHLSADETEPDSLTDCKSSTQLKQTLVKTDTAVGPSGDYKFSVQSTYTLRSVVATSSRRSSGDSMDDELYGLNDDFIEKLNVVRKKLNLIEISDDDTRLESTPICTESSTAADGVEKTEDVDSKGNTINKFYNIYQLNYINQNVEIPETNCTPQDSYYEITETEIKKKGVRGWSVTLDEFNTVFEVSPNVEKETSAADYLQLTYNPPKKKICKRVHTPILSAASNNEHIDLPYSLRVGMDTDVLKTNSRHYLLTKCTQYCGTDIADGDATHSLLDIDKAIDETQVELVTKSDVSSSEENQSSTDVNKYVEKRKSTEHKRLHKLILSDASYNQHIDLPSSLGVGIDTDILKTNSGNYLHTQRTQSCGTDIVDADVTHSLVDIGKVIDATQVEDKKSDEISLKKSQSATIKYLDNTRSSEHITSCIHLMPQVEVKTYGFESPAESTNSSSRSSSDNEDIPSPPLKNSLKVSDFIRTNDSQFRIDVISAYSSSSSGRIHSTRDNDRTSSKYLNIGNESCVSNEINSLHSALKLPNVPFEEESTCSSPISNVTTLKRCKSLSGHRSKMFNQSLKARVSDSCMTIKTLKASKSIKQPVKCKKQSSNCDEFFDIVSRTSKRSSEKQLYKSSSTISSSVSACISEEVLAENLAISPLITASLDVPRMYVKKYKFPPIAYIATCLGQASPEKVEKLMQQHQECSRVKEEEWWYKTSKALKNSDSSDSYKETAMQMMQDSNNRELAKEKKSGHLAASQKSLLSCNVYNIRKSQAQNIEFYDQNSTPQSDADKTINSKSRLVYPTENQHRRIRFADEQDASDRPSTEHDQPDEQSSEPDSDLENQGSCFTCSCFKNMFTSRETQFFA